MSLLKPVKKTTSKTFRLSCPADVLSEIQRYCATFHFEKFDDFFVQAAQYVLHHDKDWLRLKKSPDPTLAFPVAAD